MEKKIAVFILLLLFTFCGVGCGTDSALRDSGYVQITAEDAKDVMDSEEDYVILDVRTQEEYDEAHIPGAVLIPDYEIADRADAELRNKEQTILVYCRSGNRSKAACETLADMGYTDVREFGGINDWPYETDKTKSYRPCDKPGDEKFKGSDK